MQNAIEMAIVERLVSALWCARRARRFETAHLNIAAKRYLQDEWREAESKLYDAMPWRKRGLAVKSNFYFEMLDRGAEKSLSVAGAEATASHGFRETFFVSG